MFTPTKKQLEEFGFEKNEYWSYYIKLHNILDIYFVFEKSWFAIVHKYAIPVYPQSIEDVETLIRLFNPNE